MACASPSGFSKVLNHLQRSQEDLSADPCPFGRNLPHLDHRCIGFRNCSIWYNLRRPSLSRSRPFTQFFTRISERFVLPSYLSVLQFPLDGSPDILSLKARFPKVETIHPGYWDSHHHRRPTHPPSSQSPNRLSTASIMITRCISSSKSDIRPRSSFKSSRPPFG
jgi:hypothetical protein